jgi:hypothetical protein
MMKLIQVLLYYWKLGDLAQSTAFQYLNYWIGNVSDESLVEICLYLILHQLLM